MSVELATAYISLVPSLRGAKGAIAKEMGVAGGAAAATFSGAFGKKAKALIAGAGIGVAIGAIGGALKRSAEVAGEFDQRMRLVGTTLGEGAAGVKRLTDLAVDMGARTSFSAKGASDAMFELAKGGLSSAQIEAGALQSTLTLATAGGLDLAKAAEFMVQGLTAFGVKAEDSGKVAAALAGGANASTASVESLGIALGQSAAAAKVAGLSLEDTVTALAAFDNAGLKGSDAGTALKTMLMRLSPQTNKAMMEMQDLGIITMDTEAAMKTLREAGIKPAGTDVDTLTGQLKQYAMELAGTDSYNTRAQSTFNKLMYETQSFSNAFFDANGNVRSMAEISQVLQNALQGQTKEQKISTLTTLFGSDAMRAAAVITDTGAEKLREYGAAVRDQSAAEALAAEATKGFAGAKERLEGGLETLQIQIGTQLLPVLSRLMDAISQGVLPAIGDLAEKVGPPLQAAFDATGKAIGGVVDLLRTGDFNAQIGEALSVEEDSPLVDVLLKVREGFLGIKDALSGVPSDAVAALVPLFDSMQGKVVDALPAIVDALNQLGDALGGALGESLPVVGRVMLELSNTLPSVGAGFLQILPSLIGVVTNLVNFVSPLLSSETAIKLLVAGLIAWRAISLSVTAVQTALAVKTALVSTVLRAHAAVTGLIKGVQLGYTAATYGAVGATYAMNAAQKAGLVIQKGVKAALAVATAAQWAWNAALSANPIGIIIVAVAALVAGLIYFFTQTETGKKVFETVMNAIKGAVAAVVGFFQDKVVPVFKTVWGAIQTGARAVADFFTGTVAPVFQKVWGGIQDVVKKVTDFLGKVFTRIQDDFNAVGSALRYVYDNYIFPVFDLFGKITKKIADTVFKRVSEDIQKLWNAVGDAFDWVYNNVIKPVIDFFARKIVQFQNQFNLVMLALKKLWLQFASAARDVYNRNIKPVIDWFADRIAWLRDKFTAGVNAIRDAFNRIANSIKDTYNKVIKAVATWLVEKFIWARDKFRTAVDAIRDAWGRVKDTIQNVYNKNIKPIFDKFSTLIGKVKDAFGTAVDGIKKAWDGIKEAAKQPVKFVVNTVINGLIGKFNEIAKAFGSKEMPLLKLPKGFAEGGYTGPGAKYQPAGIVHADEFVVSKEARRKFESRNPGALDYLNRTGALPGYAGGGRVWPGTTRNLSGNYSGHSGIDIPDGMGMPIKAASDGKITYTGWNRGYGQAIFQRMVDGLEAVYGHTSRVLVKVGQAVRAGQKIGEVGSTGRSTGPHIHFEVNPGGGFARASNRAFTLNWLKGAKSSFAGASTDAHAEVQGFDPFGVIKDVFGKAVSSLAGLTAPIRGFVADKLKGIGENPFARLVAAVPGKIVSMVADKIGNLIGSGDGAAPGSFGKGTGHVSGATGKFSRLAAADVGPKFGFTDIGTYPGHDPAESRALDFMIKSKGQGDAAAQYMKSNAKRLGVMYLIWHRRIWSVARNSEGWRPYTRYGNTSDPSKAHTNHVHASFYANGTVGAQRGPAVVGERGAELVLGRQARMMRGGERVIPLRGGAGLGDRIVINGNVGYDPEEIFLESERRKRRAALRAGLGV